MESIDRHHIVVSVDVVGAEAPVLDHAIHLRSLQAREGRPPAVGPRPPRHRRGTQTTVRHRPARTGHTVLLRRPPQEPHQPGRVLHAQVPRKGLLRPGARHAFGDGRLRRWGGVPHGIRLPLRPGQHLPSVHRGLHPRQRGRPHQDRGRVRQDAPGGGREGPCQTGLGTPHPSDRG